MEFLTELHQVISFLTLPMMAAIQYLIEHYMAQIGDFFTQWL